MWSTFDAFVHCIPVPRSQLLGLLLGALCEQRWLVLGREPGAASGVLAQIWRGKLPPSYSSQNSPPEDTAERVLILARGLAVRHNVFVRRVQINIGRKRKLERRRKRRPAHVRLALRFPRRRPAAILNLTTAAAILNLRGGAAILWRHDKRARSHAVGRIQGWRAGAPLRCLVVSAARRYQRR